MSVSPDKKLGQHFLHDARVVERIATSIAGLLKPGNLLLEIGPGTGALTRPLLALNHPMVLLEKDARCVEALQPLLHGRPDITLNQADALEADWPALLQNRPTVVVGNLPYNVGTEIVADLLHVANGGAPITHMVFMLQKEVVQRLCAIPGNGNWGRLGVLADVLSDRGKLFDVPPGAFNPPPKVMSSIVQLTPLPKPRFPVDMKKLDILLRTAFGQRRKMLRASLREKLDETVFAKLNIDPTARPETLTTQQLCQLANNL
ncbi:MAG TPA: 16S rRNA (adenine(1518)-N(6)/adenine(1519)-N(6))-dimethyltransferase RsmA [Alphaproteobacteria bacterium]|nr:16S rRNA (adenine(1518)-N(6)/adenine(1519)-N(6))-dimethyltransferase RsmA [Alphaproteobacteria bacterium]